MLFVQVSGNILHFDIFKKKLTGTIGCNVCYGCSTPIFKNNQLYHGSQFRWRKWNYPVNKNVCLESLINFITHNRIEYTSQGAVIEITTLIVI